MRKKDLGYSGYRVPDHYFRDFEERIMSSLASGKVDIPVGRPFRTPGGYFEEFEENLLRKISEPKVIQIKPAPFYVAAVAAVLAVLLLSSVFERTQKASFEDLDVLAVENYLMETLDMMSPEETVLLDQEVYSFSQPIDIDREAVMEYLNENVEEPEILLNEN